MFAQIKKLIRNSKIIIFLYRMIFSLLTLLPKDKNLIMFESFNGRQFSDNPRAIFEYLTQNHPEFKLVWSADRRFINQFKNKNIKYVTRFSLNWLLLMPRAKYWVSNSRFPLWFRKSKRTIYLQTWHGTPLKKLGLDMDDVHIADNHPEDYKNGIRLESSKWDYLISPNRYSSNIFKSAFGFNKNMLETGYPRNDYLIQQNNESTIYKIKEKANLPKDKKIILYVPTWRDDEFYEKGKYKFQLQLNLHKMRESIGDQYIILLRMHYLVAENIDLSEFKDFVYDFSTFEDIRSLYLISDLLITDYSSAFFDYAILKKPILFFVYDIDKYRDKLRGFYFDFENSSPGPLLKTTEEIIDSIKVIEKNNFIVNNRIVEFAANYSYLEDGKATSRVVEKVFNKS